MIFVSQLETNRRLAARTVKLEFKGEKQADQEIQTLRNCLIEFKLGDRLASKIKKKLRFKKSLILFFSELRVFVLKESKN